ncbi:MAG: ABC transporter permease [Beduini sp.]|uniref:ABC transporter permease n=1 Tax=Beduini sp. TaxID=1922300 RepID=UPI0039A3168C
MSLFKRAWLYITRKKGRTVLMFFIFFIMATVIISGISIKKAAQSSMRQARQAVGSEFSLYINYDKSNPNIKQIEKKTDFGTGIKIVNEGEPISDAIVRQIGETDGIKNYNATTTMSLADNGLKSIKAPKQEQAFQFSTNGDMPNFQMNVNLNSELSSLFQNGTMKLIEGEHITPEDKQKALIHKKLAEENGLKVGDKINLKLSENISEELGATDKEVEVEIAGIFDNVKTAEDSSMLSIMMPENTIITDMETGKILQGHDVFEFDTANFYVKDPKEMTDIVNEVKKLDLDWQQFMIDQNDAEYQQIAGSIEKLDQLITTILLAAFIVSGIILTLILSLWIKSRIYETGILLSLGISKIKIIGQYIAELLLIALFAFGLSFLSGKVISQSISNSLIESVIAQKQNQSNLSTTQSVSIDMYGGLLTQEEIKELDVSVSINELAYVYMIGTALIIVSVAASSAPLLRLKPKEILSKMS